MSVKKTGTKLLSKIILANAKKEANSACIFLGYQPKMPEKVRQLKAKNE
ncbi:cyclic lactone autoinducer peptide [Acetatifactor muris]|jgi:cyclic lactone autoinducer peptide|nr:cyclic lactone autoinducer peptide [Acetatifactor muris]